MHSGTGKESYPFVGFRFEVYTEGSYEMGFAEVSGISTDVITEEIIEGGENRFKHRLPSLVSHPVLVLKRGVGTRESDLVKKLLDSSAQGIGFYNIKPFNMDIELLDETGLPVMVWSFTGVYPLKHEISALNAKSNEVVLESIELSYNTYTQDFW